MFGTSCDSSTTTCPTSGTSEIEGATIYWVKDTTTDIITLTITDENGNVTSMSVPIGRFRILDKIMEIFFTVLVEFGLPVSFGSYGFLHLLGYKVYFRFSRRSSRRYARHYYGFRK